MERDTLELAEPADTARLTVRPALWRAVMIAVAALCGFWLMGLPGAFVGAACAMTGLCFVPQDRIRPTSPARRLRDEPKLWGN